MKNFKLITLLLILGLFAGLVGCVSGKKEEEQEKEQAEYLESLPEGWKIYENKDWGFKIKYPEDWHLEIECFDPPNSNPTNTELKKAGAVNFQFTTLMYEAVVCIAIEKIFPSELCDPETGFGLDQLAKDPTYKVLEYSNITLGGQPAKKLIFLKETKKVGKLKVMVISTCYKKKYFEIIFSGGNIGEGTYKNWNKYIDVAEQMIKSFEFI